MEIERVVINNRKRAFEVHTAQAVYPFPFAKLRVRPSKEDPIVEVYVDEEVGREGFTYRLASGLEDTLHVDAVLDYNEDPAFMRSLLAYRLTVAVKEAVEKSDLSKREIIRRLGTSPSQFYRLIDTTHHDKSVGQLLFLLHVVGHEVAVVPRQESVELAAST